MVNSLAWLLLLGSILSRGLLRPEVDPDTVGRIRKAYSLGLLAYVAATLLALVVPALGLALNASLWLLWVRLCYRSAAERRGREEAGRAAA